MRRSVAAVVVALSTALPVSALVVSALVVSALVVSALPVSVASASASSVTTGTTSARSAARQALRTASQVLDGGAPRVDPTMALLHLRLTMSALGPVERRQAAAMLARPTDHPDPYGETYTVKAKRRCAGHICIHWVPTTRDAPPGQGWVDRQLKMMNQVWNYETRKLGYRRPISDGSKGGGGSGRFDVYLKELHHQGLYGLTVAEQRSSYNDRLYSSYLLLDNDFRHYGNTPMAIARVTAAHEFFHAIQFAYDAGEDPWLMEATATWMEDQYADGVNDNRQYLPWSQLAEPGTPLDTFDRTSFEEYGNWVFFEYLSERYGRGIVTSIWHHAAAFRGGGHEYSAEAIRSSLRRHGGMTDVFAKYASGNTVPAHTYSEGASYPASAAVAHVTLTQAAPVSGWTTYHVKHLASADVDATPGSDLTGTSWHLRVKVDGPRRAKMPAVAVLVRRRHHPPTRTLVQLSRSGAGQVAVPFSADTTKKVTVTLANTSTRFTCGTGTRYSCEGTSHARRPAFGLKLVAFAS